MDKSNLGLETPWGVIFYGNWDTAYKAVRYPADPFYASGSPQLQQRFRLARLQHPDPFWARGCSRRQRAWIGGTGRHRGAKGAGRVERVRCIRAAEVFHRRCRRYGQLTDYRRDAYGVMGTYALGNVILRAGWMQGGNPSCSAVRAVCLDDSLGTNQYSLGAAYTFSKRTQVYVFWTLQANDAYARYKLGSNTGPVPNSGNATIGIGTHPQTGGLGIRHTF